MQLMPLKFIRESFHWGPVLYGTSQYFTACGRFYIYHYRNKQWEVGAVRHNAIDDEHTIENFSWEMWIEDSGLLRASFRTRAELLSTLAAMLEADGLTDSSMAPIPGIATV